MIQSIKAHIQVSTDEVIGGPCGTCLSRPYCAIRIAAMRMGTVLQNDSHFTLLTEVVICSEYREEKE